MQLQNLLYRKQHLLRELTLCHDFTIKEVEKVEREEGFVIVGTGDDLAVDRDHQHRLQLLTDEMAERKRLVTKLEETKTVRDGMESKIDSSRTFLAGLPEQLRLIQGATRPLRAHFGEKEEKREEQAKASELSPPLYVLFRQLDALAGSDSSVQIVDSEPFNPTAKGEAGEADEEGRGRKKRTKVSDVSDGGGLKDGGAVDVDDLAVVLTTKVAVEGHGDVTLVLRFQRLVALNCITVEAPGFTPTLLCDLFPGDSGQNYPSPEQFRGCVGEQYPAGALARPFMWAQWLGGLGCLPEAPSGRLEASSRMVLQRLHGRVQAHTLLDAQIKKLHGLGPIVVHPTAASIFPPLSPHAPALVAFAEELALSVGVPGSRTFSASFKGSNSSVDVDITVSAAYPEVAPVFSVRSSPGGSFQQKTKDVEAEVNAFYDELVADETWDWLLSHQLRRLQVQNPPC